MSDYLHSFLLFSPLSAERKTDFHKRRFLEGISNFPLPGSDDKNLGESFFWGYEWKCIDSVCRLANAFSSNLNTIDLNICLNHGSIYRFNWLYVLIMSHTRFRVNLHSIVTWMLRNSLLETGGISEI